MPNNIVPITRVNKFFSQNEYDLEVRMAREAIESDGNFTVILYRIDREKTQYDKLYGETIRGAERYFPPVELKVMPILEEAQNKTYNPNGTLRYLQDGNFTFYIFSAQLEELGVDISFGDRIGYAVSETHVRYYEVVNDGLKNYDNKHTILGYKAAYRTIKCVSIDDRLD